MKAKNEENQKQDKKKRKKSIEPMVKLSPGESFPSELSEPRWSVVSFETCLASNLTYEQAARKMKKSAAEKVSGLCIITDEAAQKVNDKK